VGIKLQFLWSIAPLLVISAVNIISVPLFYRYLGAEMYAIWFYVNTLNGSFGFADLGLGTAVGRYLGIALGEGNRAALRQYWGTGNLLAIPVVTAMGIVFIGLGAYFGPKWFHVSPDHINLLRWAFVAGGFGLCVGYYSNFWQVLSQAHFDFKFVGLWRSVLNVAQVLTCILLARLTGNPLILIWVSTLFGLIQMAVLIWHANKNYGLALNLGDARMARVRELFGISNKTLGTILAGSFGGAIDRILLGRLASSVVFANYNICYNFGSRIMGLGASVMGPVFFQTSRAVGKGSREQAAAIFNETFDFTFGFYTLAALWTIFWHPIFLRLWLGSDLGTRVAPVFTPLVIAFCLSGIGSLSSAQLIPLNRAGMELIFSVVRTILLGLFVLAGWHWGNLIGVAWGVLASRIAWIAQDLYTIRLVGGGGWLAWRTWRHLLKQCAVGGVFFALSRFGSPTSCWQTTPAILHGGLVTAWLLRHQLRKFLSGAMVK
jgi:O-antigen/teichoic acid export membrane protein